MKILCFSVELALLSTLSMMKDDSKHICKSSFMEPNGFSGGLARTGSCFSSPEVISIIRCYKQGTHLQTELCCPEQQSQKVMSEIDLKVD